MKVVHFLNAEKPLLCLLLYVTTRNRLSRAETESGHSSFLPVALMAAIDL